VQDNLLTVKLFVNENIQVINVFLDIDGYVDAATSNHDWNRLGVILIFQKQSKLLFNLSQLVRDKSELNASARISLNFSCSLKGNLSKEFIEHNHLRCTSFNVNRAS